MLHKRSWLRVPVTPMLCAAYLLLTAATSAPVRVAHSAWRSPRRLP